MSEEEAEKRNDLFWKIFLGFQSVLLSIALLWVRSVGEVQSDLDDDLRDLSERLTVIESSRCTSSDCASIRSDLVSMRAKVANFPESIPPKWFENKVDGLEADVKAIENYIWRGAPSPLKREGPLRND